MASRALPAWLLACVFGAPSLALGGVEPVDTDYDRQPLHTVVPEYPEKARRERIEGEVRRERRPGAGPAPGPGVLPREHGGHREQRGQKVGATGHATTIVSDGSTARALGSGDVPVFGTPALLALLEAATVAAAAESLSPGSTTVGLMASPYPARIQLRSATSPHR